MVAPNNPGQWLSVIGSTGIPYSTNATAYYDNGWVQSRTGPDGQTTSYQYWADGQTMTVTDPLGHQTSYFYDDAGRQSQVWDALNRPTRFVYDALGRQVKTVFADGSFVTNQFNNLGQRVGHSELHTPTIARVMPREIRRWDSFSATKPSRSEGKLAYSDRTAKRLAHLVPLSCPAIALSGGGSRSTQGRGFASLFHLSTPGSLSVMAATGPAMSPDLLRQPTLAGKPQGRGVRAAYRNVERRSGNPEGKTGGLWPPSSHPEAPLRPSGG